MFWVSSGVGGGGFPSGCSITRVVLGRTVRLFADKTEAVPEASATFDRGQVQCIDIHGIWVSRGMRVRWAKTLIGAEWLGAISMVHEGDLSSDLLLEMKVGSFFVPEGKDGWYCIHGLDTMHDPSGDPCGEIRDQGGSVFHFIVFGADNVQLECIDVFLELFSGIDASGGQPIHGFTGSIGVNKGIFKILLELGECSK